MSVIPDSIYRLVEEKLRSRLTLIAKARSALYAAQSAAISISAPPMEQDHVRSGSAGDRTARAALKILAAEEQLSDAEKWGDTFRLLDSIFPGSTPEGAVAADLYDKGMTQEEVCRVLRCDRQTVRRRRDNYVVHAALIAASKGLVQVGEPEED